MLRSGFLGRITDMSMGRGTCRSPILLIQDTRKFAAFFLKYFNIYLLIVIDMILISHTVSYVKTPPLHDISGFWCSATMEFKTETA